MTRREFLALPWHQKILVAVVAIAAYLAIALPIALLTAPLRKEMFGWQCAIVDKIGIGGRDARCPSDPIPDIKVFRLPN